MHGIRVRGEATAAAQGPFLAFLRAFHGALAGRIAGGRGGNPALNQLTSLSRLLLYSP